MIEAEAMKNAINAFQNQTLVAHVDNATFSTTAVQCSQTETEQFYAPYCDDDIIQHAAVRRIADILSLAEDNITLFEVDEEQRVLRVERGEKAPSSYEQLTLVIQELLTFYLDLEKEIVSIDQILYPVEIFGPFRIIVDKEKNSATVRMYSQFGTLCCRLAHVCVSDERSGNEADLAAGACDNDSPTIKCMMRIGIDCTKVDKQETFTSMGLDSLKTAELEMALQVEYPDYPIPTATLLTYPTVEKMDSYLFSCARDLELKTNKDVDACSNCIPLSPQQRRIVFICELEPESRAQFNEPVVFSISSNAFDQQKFESVLNCIVMRHTILRTTYLTDCQIITSGTESFFASRVSCSDPRGFVTQAVDISHTSLHFAVYRSAGRVTVCIVFHHVAVDGQSISIIMEEIEALYYGAKLPSPAAQYKDYANLVSQLDFTEKLLKWKKKFACREFQLLPTDRPRSAAQTFIGSAITKIVPARLQSCLQRLRKLGNCTDFCILVSIYKLLVFKTTGIGDLAIGFPSSLREGGFLRTVGCFVNTVPLLTGVDSSLTVQEYLVSVSTATNEARNMDVPFDLIVSELKLERDDGVTPLFQVLLVMDNVRVPSKESGITFLDLPTHFSKYEQIWYFQKDTDSLSIKVEYNCSLFLEETIADLVQRFLYLMAQLGNSPPQTVLNEVALATKAEFYSVVRKKAANECDFPLVCIPQLLRNNLLTESVLHYGDMQLSYCELEMQSDQIARSISNKYCTYYGELPSRDRCGAVFMERSLELLQVVFGIWKCGLQVVPFSLDWPVQRSLDALEMFANPILVNFYSAELTETAKHTLYPVIQKFRKAKPCRKCLNLIDPSDLAYITCTSGTTGKPKYVCTEFLGHGNLAQAYTKNFHLSSESCTYQVVNYGFDIFFADLSKTFANGAAMVLATELIPQIEEMRNVTNAYIMPTYLSSLTPSNIEQLGFLETLQFGGEAIQAKALQHLLKTGVQLYQEHGITEQTVYTAANKVKTRTPIPEIGAPFSNLWVLVRDPDGHLLPEQYRGMYYANGLGLTRGYYKMPERNLEITRYGNFGREIKTGDILNYHQQRVYFVGRADHQVKIRGKIVDLIEVGLFFVFNLVPHSLASLSC
ncbi:AMP-binding enzyme [Oesophagostomum dentatum]|uniref:AMP-binding enzyme n=1 Tax=Oesophagostomum dentatum TaxID=61180 RepID=A0A0B1TQI5_OESDE|nr:AMP-binding enzyme [Oesophagostomum dentatum]